MYRQGFSYAKAGVMLVDLQPQGQQQGELDLVGETQATPGEQTQESEKLMGAIDAMNRRFERGAVTVASAMKQARHVGNAGRRERRSPRYTTRLEEIVTVQA